MMSSIAVVGVGLYGVGGEWGNRIEARYRIWANQLSNIPFFHSGSGSSGSGNEDGQRISAYKRTPLENKYKVPLDEGRKLRLGPSGFQLPAYQYVPRKGSKDRLWPIREVSFHSNWPESPETMRNFPVYAPIWRIRRQLRDWLEGHREYRQENPSEREILEAKADYIRTSMDLIETLWRFRHVRILKRIGLVLTLVGGVGAIGLLAASL